MLTSIFVPLTLKLKIQNKYLLLFYISSFHLTDIHSCVFTGGQISVVQALLEELPNQFLTFMRSRDIKPLASHFPHASSTQ
jgi:hypothetical protein